MKNSKKIILSVALLSALNAFGATNTVNPLSPSFKALDNGGSLDAIDAYQDGVGVVITGDNTIVINNSPMNTLVFKYGEAAKENGVPLVEQVQVDGTLTDKELASIILENVPNGTACNDNNTLTENDVYTNGVCAGTPIQSCATGYSGDVTSGIFCFSQGLTDLNNWTQLTKASYVNLYNNPLTNVDGLLNLVEVSESLSFRNNNLSNVNGLSNLRIVGNLSLDGNPNLMDLSALNNTAMIDGSLLSLDNRVYSVKFSSSSPICESARAGKITISGTTINNVCN